MIEEAVYNLSIWIQQYEINKCCVSSKIGMTVIQALSFVRAIYDNLQNSPYELDLNYLYY